MASNTRIPKAELNRHLRRDGQADVPQDARRCARAGRGGVARRKVLNFSFSVGRKAQISSTVGGPRVTAARRCTSGGRTLAPALSRSHRVSGLDSGGSQL
jgi:hypothetical protein